MLTRLLKVIQWFVVAFFLALLMILAFDISKLSITDAPVLLFGLVVAICVAGAILHSPKIFFRLPLKVKLGAYAGILLAMALVGTYLGQMQQVYHGTPEGMAEAAQERSAAVREAEEAAARSAAYANAVVNGNGEVDPSWTEEEDAACAKLVSAVIDMSKGGRGPEIIEINEVRAHQSMKSDATCAGDAITDRGSGIIEFGTEKTPQGNELLTSSYPYGLN